MRSNTTPQTATDKSYKESILQGTSACNTPRRNHLDEEKVSYGTATRSKTEVAYHLIPPIAHEAEANTFFIGIEKHGEGNWKHGDKQFVKQLFNHIEMHIKDIKDCAKGTSKESVYRNVGAIKWAASAILWYEQNQPSAFYTALGEMEVGLVEPHE